MFLNFRQSNEKAQKWLMEYIFILNCFSRSFFDITSIDKRICLTLTWEEHLTIKKEEIFIKNVVPSIDSKDLWSNLIVKNGNNS